MEERKRLLDGDRIHTRVGDWQKLTYAEQAGVFGYWDALRDTLMDELEFRYLISGLWYTPDEVCNRKDGTDPARNIPSPCTNGHYVYRFDHNGRIEFAIYF